MTLSPCWPWPRTSTWRGGLAVSAVSHGESGPHSSSPSGAIPEHRDNNCDDGDEGDGDDGDDSVIVVILKHTVDTAMRWYETNVAIPSALSLSYGDDTIIAAE